MKLKGMSNHTRSAQKSKGEMDGLSPNNKMNRKELPKGNSEKADVWGVRRSAWETSLSRQTTSRPQSRRKSEETPLSRQTMSSPQSMRKSKETSLSRQTMPSLQSLQKPKETSLSGQVTPISVSIQKSKHLEMGISPLTPSIRRISKVLEKHNTPSPLRRSDRCKKNLPSSSGSKQLAKDHSLSKSQKTKEKILIQVTMESKKAELDLEPVGIKRKKMNARTFKGLFKRQRILEFAPAATESEGLTCSTRSQDGSVSSESHEKCMHAKVAGDSPSPSPKCENQNLLQTCVLCSKNKRIGYDSPEQDLCPCGPMVEEDTCCFSTCKRPFGAELSTGVSAKRIALYDEQESLHRFLQGEMRKLCQILELSEDTTHVARRFLDYVLKNHNVSSDSHSIIQAFQISLCWIAASITKQRVDKKDSLVLGKQLLNYQCSEQQVNLVFSKMRCLKRMYLQCLENTIDSGGRSLLDEDSISQEPSNVSQGGSHFPSCKQKNKKVEIVEKSGSEENSEEQILLQKKLKLKDTAAASEIDNAMKKIQKKCDKWVKKLTLKHQKEIQEFHRIWDEKRVKLETDHKLESAFIRSMHGQDSVQVDKLKLLDNNFAKKMEEHNLLKDAQLIDLQAEQLAALNEERRKVAHWLAKAKSCSRELRVANGLEPLGSYSEDEAGGLQSRGVINIMSPGVVFPLSGKHLEGQNPSESFCTQGNDAIPSISINLPADAIGYGTPIENMGTVTSKYEVGVASSSLDIMENLNQSKKSCDNQETAFKNFSTPVEQGSDENRSVDVSVELPIEEPETVASEVAGHAYPVQSSNASKKESDKESKIALPDALVSRRNGPDETASRSLERTGQPLEHTEQTTAMPDCSNLLPQQAQEVKIGERLVSAELQDLDTAAAENLSSLYVGIATMELVDSATLGPSNGEVPVTDEIIIPASSNHEAPVIANSEQLHSVSADVSLSCNEFPAIEGDDHGRSSSQTVEPGRTDVLSRESASESGGSLASLSDLLHIGPVNSVTYVPSVELSASSLNDVARHSVGVIIEQTGQAVLPLGIDAGHLQGPSSLLTHPTHQSSSWNSSPALLADPLHDELERMCKETEQLEKTQEDRISQMKSDCGKEILETTTQIRNQYGVKLQEIESEFRWKRDELDKKQNQVLKNKKLAEAFTSKCMDFRPSGLQGIPSGGFMQQRHQILLPPSVRPSPVASACPPVPTLQITTPAVQTMQRPSLPHSVLSSPTTSQSATSLSVEAVRHAPALSSGASSRAPVIRVITPASNPWVGGEVRSPAPHLRSFRSPSAASIPPNTINVSSSAPTDAPFSACTATSTTWASTTSTIAPKNKFGSRKQP